MCILHTLPVLSIWTSHTAGAQLPRAVELNSSALNCYCTCSWANGFGEAEKWGGKEAKNDPLAGYRESRAPDFPDTPLFKLETESINSLYVTLCQEIVIKTRKQSQTQHLPQTVEGVTTGGFGR